VIEVVVGIVAARIVSDPMVVMVHVRRVRMTGHIGLTVLEAAAAVWRVSGRSRTVRRNMAAAEARGAAAGVAHAAAGRMADAAAAAAARAAATASPLCKGGLGNDQEYDERSKKSTHGSSAACDGKGDAHGEQMRLQIVDC
jgi:hypothetical protein